MGKKKSNAANAARVMESKVSPILEITYPDPLFSVAAHPTKPIIVQGLATGHIFCTEYNAEKLEEKQQESRDNFIKEQQEAFKKGKISSVIKSVSQLSHKWWNVINDISSVNDPLVKTLWKTKRHKGSCRSIIFDPLEGSLGENIYSVGTDHVIKKANTETGKVCGKVDISRDYIDDTDSATKLCHSATHNMLLAGTEGGHVLVYDSSNLSKSKIKFKVPNVHDDCINHILPMPDVSAYHYLTVGSTTLSHIDVRKGIVTQSDDQEDELLSMCYASDHVNDHKNDVVLVSHGEGIVTIWKNSKNHWRDQLSRIKVNKGVSLDAIVPSMNCDSEEMTNSIWCGDADGLLHRINYKMGKVVETRVHSNTAVKYGAVDEVSVLDIDYNYRLISSGMDSLKIWSEQVQDDIIEESLEDDSDNESISGDEFSSDMESDVSIEVKEEADSSIEDEGSSDLSGSEEEVNNNLGNDDDDHSTNSSDNDTEGATIEIKRKKRIISSIKPKRKLVNLNKEFSTPEETSESKKIKTKQLTNKQLRNMQQHEHGIRKFDDL